MNKHKFNIFPKADEEDFAAIVADMKEYGYDTTQPVVVYQGEVLDGWNRWLAAKEAGVTAAQRQFHGTDEEALIFTLRTNKRRNMTSSQRAAYAAQADEIIETIRLAVEEARRVKQAEAAKEQHKVSNPRAGESFGLGKELPKAKDPDKNKTATKTAEIFNTNRTYVSDAKKIKEESAEVFNDVLEGRTSIAQAKKIIATAKEVKQERKEVFITPETPLERVLDTASVSIAAPVQVPPQPRLKTAEEIRAEQDAIMEEAKRRVKEEERERKKARALEIAKERAKVAQKAQAVPKQSRFKVLLGSLETADLGGEKFDYIITDPPYPKEFLPLWSVLAKRASEWLKPGGLVIAMSGQAYLDQVYAMMSEHLEYYWTACYYTPGQPTPLRQVNVNTTWKPLLIYKMKGDTYKGKIFGDVSKSEGNDKDFHKWGQSVSGMEDIIKRICIEGVSILDPFCGAGTTGVAALSNGCLFTGIELDETNQKISIARLQEVSA